MEKKLMKNNTKILLTKFNGEWAVGALATVVIKEKDGAIQEYQGVYNRGFYLFMLLSNLKC
jgi:hypothetical protein